MLPSILLAALVATTAPGGAPGAAGVPAPPSLLRLAWLQGCWEARFPGVTICRNRIWSAAPKPMNPCQPTNFRV